MKNLLLLLISIALFACQSADTKTDKEKKSEETVDNKEKKIDIDKILGNEKININRDDKISTITAETTQNNITIDIPNKSWALTAPTSDKPANMTALENFISILYKKTNISPETVFPAGDYVFKETDLDTFVDAMARNLKFSYILSPNMRGINLNINLEYRPGKMTYQEAWMLFNHILKLNNAYLSVDKKGQVLTIRSNADMKTDERIQFPSDGQTPSLTIAKISVTNSKVGDLLTILKTSLGFNTAAAHPNGRDIIIVDNSERITVAKEMVKYLDDGGRANWQKRVIACHNTLALTVAEEIQDILPILGLPVSLDNESAERGDIIVYPIERHNAIFVSTPNKETLELVTSWAKQLDKKSEVSSEQLFIYPVKHSEASELISVLQTFFPNTEAESSPERDRKSTSSRAGDKDKDSKSKTKSKTASKTTTKKSSSKSSDTLARKSIFETPLTLYEDARLNRIVIRTVPRAFATIKAILKSMDTPALQALIRVTAVDISLGDGLEYGVAYALRNSNSEVGSNTSKPTNDDGNETDGSISVPNIGGSGLQTLFISSDGDDFAFIKALSEDNETKILNTPEILVKNQESAKIEIGSSVPYEGGSTQNSSTTETNIEYRDTGVLLEVTPNISLDNRISLEIKQEISSVADNTIEGINSPIFNKNLLETVLSVENGQTILIGGIIQSQKGGSRSGIPYLMDIPYIGALFRTTSNSDARTELVVLIKATVIDNESSLEGVISRYQTALKHMEETKNDLK